MGRVVADSCGQESSCGGGGQARSRPDETRGESAAFREEAGEFADLLDMLSGAFYRCETEAPWRLISVSRGIEELTGYPASHFAGNGWAELVHPDDLPRLEESVASAVAAGRPFEAKYRLVHRSGKVRWVKEQGKAVSGCDGRPSALEGMIIDVTEEHRLQEMFKAALEAAEAYATRLDQVLESTSDCVFTVDEEWRFTFVNGRAAAEMGPREQLLGQKLTDAFPELAGSPFLEAYREVMEKREPRRIEATMPGGGSWYEAYAAPIAGGMTVFFRNVDIRKRAEDALRQSEAQFKKTLDHLPQMVWSTLPAGYHDYYSRLWYEFTGVPEGSTDGEAWNGMFHPDDRERAWALWRHSLRTGEPYEIEYRLRHRSGEYRWVLGRASAERNADGQIVRWYGTCTDIHDRVSAQQALQQTQTLQQGILDSSADCIKILALDGTLRFMNKPGLRAMELASLGLVEGRNWPSLWPPASRSTAQAAIDQALGGQPARFSGPCPTATGRNKWWDVVVSPIADEAGEITSLLCISRDITALRDTSEQLKWASEHDALTSLPNRRAFEARLQAATIRAMETGGMIGLLLLDLDHFKHVNDSLGHAAGDQLLATFAQRLKGSVRTGDVVARLGGDEFAVILDGVKEEEDLMRAGSSILSRLQAPIRVEGRVLSASASIGGALFPRDASTADELFKNADTALYALKAAGRGGTKMFHNHMREQAQKVASQLSLARVALSARSVIPHYQPKVDLETGAVVGFEALLRWKHPRRGIQHPETVAEAFKDYELASRIGELMQTKVMADLREWRQRGLDVGPVSINAAPAEFLRDDYAERLLGLLRRFEVAPHMIEIEVTEHVFIERGSDLVARALEMLNAAGVRISLDDFGTGYSSLSHLRDFPVDVVKIDRSFVQRMLQEEEIASIVSAVIDLARSLSLDVVAEGVETEEQRIALARRGCTFGQGFLFGKAVRAEEVRALPGKHRAAA